MTPKPSRSGICTSRNITEGCSLATRSSAFAPLLASPTTNTSSWARACGAASRAQAARRRRSGRARYLHAHDQALGPRDEVEAGTLAVERSEPPVQVAEPDARHRGSRRGSPSSSISMHLAPPRGEPGSRCVSARCAARRRDGSSSRAEAAGRMSARARGRASVERPLQGDPVGEALRHDVGVGRSSSSSSSSRCSDPPAGACRCTQQGGQPLQQAVGERGSL